MRTLDVIVAVLLVVGGLNWGLVGLFDFDLVQHLEVCQQSKMLFTYWLDYQRFIKLLD